MDFVGAYTVIKDDEGWVGKLIVGGLVALFSFFFIPILLLLGYQVGVTRNVMRGKERPLPAWGEDLGQLLKDGLLLWVAQLAYALPIILISLCFWIVFVPVGLAEDADLQTALTGLSVVVTIIVSCLLILYGIALAFLVPALFIQYARTGEFGSLFRISEVVGIARDNLVDILLTIVATIAASMLLGVVVSVSLITLCGPIILPFLGSFWLAVGSAHLYGQIGRKMDGKSVAFA